MLGRMYTDTNTNTHAYTQSIILLQTFFRLREKGNKINKIYAVHTTTYIHGHLNETKIGKENEMNYILMTIK